MRRSGHPSRPRAITCSFFRLAQDVAHIDEGYMPTPKSTSRASFPLAGFQVTLIGRFWVTAGEHGASARLGFVFLRDCIGSGALFPSQGKNPLIHTQGCMHTQLCLVLAGKRADVCENVSDVKNKAHKMPKTGFCWYMVYKGVGALELAPA
jgi:hypothetical protein